MRSSGTLLVVAVVVLAVRTPLSAQGNRWERQVSDQLQRAVATLHGKGAGRPELTRVGPLNMEESESFPVTLQAGVAYFISGVCDNDCTSLHLVLANAAHNEVAVDRLSENYPVLRFTPPETMRYRVTVTMAACQMNPCWYGVAVYRK
jgi:hypothetical protein